MPETQDPMQTPAPKADEKPPLFQLAGLVDALTEDAAMRRQAKLENRPIGPVTGFPTLDAMLSGCLMPGLHVLHGGPGTGKTALALQIASSCQCPALFVSCEIDPIEALRRLIARHTGTYLNHLKDGKHSADHVRSLALTTCQAFPMLGILEATHAKASTVAIGEALESMKGSPSAKLATAPGALIVVDSGNTWASKNADMSNEYEALTWTLGQMEALSKLLAVPVLIIAERNRGSMESGGQNSSKGTGRWEYAGESVFGVDREKEEESPDGWTKVKLTVSKNRHGKTGCQLLRWHGDTQKYEVRPK